MTDHNDATIKIAEQLSQADIPLRSGEQPDWDREARLLVARAVADDPARSVDQLVANRLSGIPLAYLAGTEAFLGDEFEVEPGVVIPHPATELLAMLAVQAVRLYRELTDHPVLMEVGVGVGVIALSVLKRCPETVAHASELSGAALRLTKLNASRILPGTEHLYLYQAYVTDDIFLPFAPRQVSGVNVLVANPPYLIEGDEVSEATKKSGIAHFSYAPENDPSWFLRRVVSAPAGLLSQNCSVFMECAEWYLPDHRSVMQEAGWSVEVFDREKYIARFGRPPEMHEMTPTGHRVLHAWRGVPAMLGAEA